MAKIGNTMSTNSYKYNLFITSVDEKLTLINEQ